MNITTCMIVLVLLNTFCMTILQVLGPTAGASCVTELLTDTRMKFLHKLYKHAGLVRLTRCCCADVLMIHLMQRAVCARRDAVSEDNTEKIKAATEALQKEMMDMGAAMYQQAGAAGSPGSGAADGSSSSSSSSSSSGPAGGDDNVIDAEFTDKKE
jgi:hypothetical protein